jgi:hypothetical protein
MRLPAIRQNGRFKTCPPEISQTPKNPSSLRLSKTSDRLMEIWSQRFSWEQGELFSKDFWLREKRRSSNLTQRMNFISMLINQIYSLNSPNTSTVDWIFKVSTSSSSNKSQTKNSTQNISTFSNSPITNFSPTTSKNKPKSTQLVNNQIRSSDNKTMMITSTKPKMS